MALVTAFGFILALLSSCLVEKNLASELMCSGLKQLQYPKTYVDVEDNGTSFRVEGFKFPASSIQEFKNEIFTVCPCKVQRCIEHCSNLKDAEQSLNRTRPYLPLYSVLYKRSQDFEKKPIQVKGKSWSTDDLFKEYFVVKEALYNKTPSYSKLDPGDVSLDDLSRVCFAFSEENQVIFYEKEVSQAPNIFAICCAVSVGCLGILLISFVITKEIKFFEGKCIFCNTLMLMVNYVELIVNYWSLIPLNTALCYVTGFSSYFTCMSSFFWLNVLCFYKYWTSCIRLSSKSNDSSLFWKCFIYASSFPAMLTLVLLWNRFFYNPSYSDTFKTDIGINQCYQIMKFGENYKIAVTFFHGPLVFILLLNFVLFCLALGKLVCMWWQLGIVAAYESSDEQNNMLKVLMYIASSTLTFDLMWLVEIGGWIFRKNSRFLFAFNIINHLSGLWLLIFCVFLNKRVRTSLLRKLTCRTADYKMANIVCISYIIYENQDRESIPSTLCTTL